MSVALYFDEHVPAAITKGLRLRGVDVLTVQEDGHRETDDDVILDRAMELGRVMFTRDPDFLGEASVRQREGRPFAGVIFARQVVVSIGQCVSDLEIIAGASNPHDFVGRVYYLPL